MLNKQKGNMYGFVSHTWNPIKGKCPHDCSYCYMKRFPQGELRLDKKCLKDNLGSGNFIFVGSSTDMFAKDVPLDWIIKVIDYCRKFPNNKYLFQSKDPCRMYEIFRKIPKFDNVVYGTTIETDILFDNISNAPPVTKRAWWIQQLNTQDIMVTIEPIMDFNLDLMVKWLRDIKPKWVNIGADSKGHNLPEPSPEKVNALIKELKKFTEVKIKPNLKRLMT